MKSDVAKLTGLKKRGGVYQLRVLIPEGLQDLYDGRSRITKTLKTGDHRESVLRGTSLRAKFLEEFAHKRLLQSPQKLDVVSPELASELAARIRARVLRNDEDLRGGPAAPLLSEIAQVVSPPPLPTLTIRAHVAALEPVKAIADDDGLGGLCAPEAEVLASLNGALSDSAAVALASPQLPQ